MENKIGNQKFAGATIDSYGGMAAPMPVPQQEGLVDFILSRRAQHIAEVDAAVDRLNKALERAKRDGFEFRVFHQKGVEIPDTMAIDMGYVEVTYSPPC